jgi:hypothetical protein
MDHLIKFLILLLVFNSCKENKKDLAINKCPNSALDTFNLKYGKIDSCINCFHLSFLHNKDTSEFYYFSHSLTPDGDIYSFIEIEYNDSIQYCKEYDLINHEIITEGHVELERIEANRINHKLSRPLYQFKLRRTKTWIYHEKESKTIIYYPQLNQKLKVVEIDNDGNLKIDSSRLYDFTNSYYNYLII